MFVELPQELILATIGAFLLGWILSAVSSKISAGQSAKKRDPRDDRIRELEAELRIAHVETEKLKSSQVELEEDFKETKVGLERRDDVISDQQSRLDEISTSLKESVIKTRELRAELTDRATASVHAEAKIREVQTELSVAQASTDMIATGVLDYALAPEQYSLAPEQQVPENDVESLRESAKARKAAR